MVSVALDGTRLGTADDLTRPGTWPVSPRCDLGSFSAAFVYGTCLRRDRAITPSFARP